MIFESLSMLPLVKDKGVWTKFISSSINKSKSPPISFLFKAFIVMHVVFKILGVKAFQKMSLLHNMVSVARKAIYHHFEQITKVFRQDNYQSQYLQ